MFVYVHNPSNVWGQHVWFFKEIKTFIQQGCIQFIKSDSQDIYNVTQDLGSVLLTACATQTVFWH